MVQIPCLLSFRVYFLSSSHKRKWTNSWRQRTDFALFVLCFSVDLCSHWWHLPWFSLYLEKKISNQVNQSMPKTFFFPLMRLNANVKKYDSWKPLTSLRVYRGTTSHLRVCTPLNFSLPKGSWTNWQQGVKLIVSSSWALRFTPPPTKKKTSKPIPTEDFMTFFLIIEFTLPLENICVILVMQNPQVSLEINTHIGRYAFFFSSYKLCFVNF